LKHSQEEVSNTLVDILTRYLKNSWAGSAPRRRTVTPTTNMVKDLQLDSFQVMEFMLEVEDHYDVSIDLESLSNIHTINDLAGIVIAGHTQ